MREDNGRPAIRGLKKRGRRRRGLRLRQPAQGLLPSGDSFIFAKNHVALCPRDVATAGKRVAPDDYRSEFCGACFDPAGSALFVNVQSPGITFPISGPLDPRSALTTTFGRRRARPRGRG